jgi:hypothetical protein
MRSYGAPAVRTSWFHFTLILLTVLSSHEDFGLGLTLRYVCPQRLKEA